MSQPTTWMENFFASTMENRHKKENVKVEESSGKKSLLERMQEARLREAERIIRDNNHYL